MSVLSGALTGNIMTVEPIIYICLTMTYCILFVLLIFSKELFETTIKLLNFHTAFL